MKGEQLQVSFGVRTCHVHVLSVLIQLQADDTDAAASAASTAAAASSQFNMPFFAASQTPLRLDSPGLFPLRVDSYYGAGAQPQRATGSIIGEPTLSALMTAPATGATTPTGSRPKYFNTAEAMTMLRDLLHKYATRTLFLSALCEH